MTLKERFESKYIAEPNSGCWLWTDYIKNNSCYGRIKVDGEMILSHRLSWMIHFGEIPYGFRVLHTCDTPSCVNPSHLFLGTQRDNMLDAVRKNRVHPPKLRGELHPAYKLTQSQVSDILRDNRTLSKIANCYGVSASLISLIKLRRIWKPPQLESHRKAVATMERETIASLSKKDLVWRDWATAGDEQ